MSIASVQKQLTDWQEKEAILEQMIPLIGRLYRHNNVVISIYGRSVINQSVINLVKSHRFVRQTEGHELEPVDSLAILQLMDRLDLGACHVDIGKLAIGYRQQTCCNDLDSYLRQQLTDVIGQYSTNQTEQPRRDVVLYGFGRIGRFLARILIEKSGGSPLALRAIVVRKSSADNDLVKRASLLRRDSVHGSFEGTISIDEDKNAIIANGNYIQVIYANNPAEVDYTQYGIENALIIDNTGVWRDAGGLAQHLRSHGAAKVLLTAPGKGDIKNIVYGINHQTLTEDDKIISAASCTTNAITPILKVIHDAFGIQHGHVETVHSYTNDQNLIDNFHKGDRRGRSAPLNMVLTETGAAKAVAKALPELAGKLTGNAIRVPTPNVSLAILNLDLTNLVSRGALNEVLRERSLYSELHKQIDFVNSPEAVSSDFVGNRRAGIVDAKATIVSGQKAVLYVWYDNEAGYSAQVMRLVQKMAGVHYRMFPG